MAAGARFFHRVVVPTPFKVGPANVYVFTDGPVTLIDCGPNTSAAENALRLGLAEHGLHLEQIAPLMTESLRTYNELILHDARVESISRHGDRLVMVLQKDWRVLGPKGG